MSVSKRLTVLLGIGICLVSSLTAVDDFPLVFEDEAVALVVSNDEAAPVLRAVSDLSADIFKVTGYQPVIYRERSEDAALTILVGQVGTGGEIDELIKSGSFDGAELVGEWESFVIEEIQSGTQRILVVAGSDVRGTIYGIYELAQSMGVSPWYWWADVPVLKNSEAVIPGQRRRFGPPSVKYRGIFINDEDWGLQPWASKTLDPELGDVGPATYAKVFELLLRLRANCLWPAMHKVSRPFNEDSANAELAHAYGVVMSSSHAEPMLRNNVREWSEPHEDYNYYSNSEGVLSYWRERVISNGDFENIYTLGMRGIHDSGMQGGKSKQEQIELLEKIIDDQRSLLKTHVDANVEEIPQVFVAYKEVLDLYRAGLRIPEDVTVVWPDDNFSYIRNFASAQERDTRKGGFGVYYHISYLGRPMAYLWLNTTPPALIWEEMTQAYETGADRLWILNVGDIKPAEIGMDFFFSLAWDVEHWDVTELPRYLSQWAGRTFGRKYAEQIADIMGQYYLLNFRRKPEHLQYHLPRTSPQWSSLSDLEIETRLHSFEQLSIQVTALQHRLSAEQQDAFYELVAYPVLGSAAANERYFWTERYRKNPSIEAVTKAWQAQEQLVELTRVYNEDIAEGKWNHIMSLEPADDDWSSMRIAPLEIPNLPDDSKDIPILHETNTHDNAKHICTRSGGSYNRIEGNEKEWVVIPGLGRSGEAVRFRPLSIAGDNFSYSALIYDIDMDNGGQYLLTVEMLPTFSLKGTDNLIVEVSINNGATQSLHINRKAGDLAWKLGVLRGYVSCDHEVTLRHGPNQIKVVTPDDRIVIDQIHISKIPTIGSE